MIKNILILLCILLQQAYAEKKALIIGNQNYFNKAEILQNPINDAKDFSTKLKKFGFNINATYMDLDSSNLKFRINNFINEIKNDDEIVFYYSGHGLEDDNKNLLIPIDTNNIINKQSLHENAYSLSTFLLRIKDIEARIVIVILDSCRVNPYLTKISGSKGGMYIPKTIPRNQELPKDKKENLYTKSNLLIAYATAPGELAKDGMVGITHSPYTEELLNNFDKFKNENILMFFNQVSLDVKKLTDTQSPWNSSGGIPKFCFDGCSINNNKVFNSKNNKWQDIKDNSNQVFTYKEASQYCENKGMRLATMIELKKLYWNRSTLNYNSNLKYWSSDFENNTNEQMVHTLCFSENCDNSTLGSSVDRRHYVRCINK